MIAPLDLSACEAEPIHAPGCLQPHGVLLALDRHARRVVQAGGNAADLLGCGEPLAGADLETVLGPEAAAAVRNAADEAGDDPAGLGVLAVGAAGRGFDASLHRNPDGVPILELEPAPAGGWGGPDPVTALTAAVARLERADGLDGFLAATAVEIRRLTGCDRVSVYRFDDDWHGQVVAEDRRADLEPFLGLHFPASDVPAQARALYLTNRLRVIPDAAAAAVPLVPAVYPDGGRPLDLSRAGLRAVAPVHLEYLANMGVRATVVASLVVGGRLWGLIAGHFTAARRLPPPTRRAVGLLGQLVSLQLAARLTDQAAAARAEAATRIESLTVAGQELAGVAAEIFGLVAAAGAAVVDGSQLTAAGDTPPADRIAAAAAWALDRAGPDGLAATDRLAADGPSAAHPAAAGLLAAVVSRDPDTVLLWFRPEQPQTFLWAGDPTKPAAPTAAGRLRPRASFAAWQTEVRGRSAAWTAIDRQTAGLVRDGIRAARARQAAESARRAAESARRFAASFDAAGVGMALVDRNGGILEANLALGRLIGYTPAELVGRPTEELAHPDDRGLSGPLRRRVWAGAADTFTVEKRYRRRDGQTVVCVVTGSAVREADGPDGYFVVHFQDVTARKAAEEALRASEEFTRRLTDIAPSILYVYDLDERRNVWGNREMTDILGYTRPQIEAMTGHLLATLMHPDDFARYPGHATRLTALGDDEAAEFEYRLRAADGSWRWLYSRDMAFRRAADGRVTQIVGAALDVTARKVAELALSESEGRLRTLADSIPDGAVYRVVQPADGTAQFTHMSAGIEQIAGVRTADVLADADVLHRLIHPDDQAGVLLAEAASARDLTPFDMDFRQYHTSGDLRWVHCRSRPRRRADGGTEWDGVVTDITARKQAEAARQQADARFEAFLTHLPHPAWVKDDGGRYEVVNPAFARHFPADDPVGRTDTQAFPPELAGVLRRNDRGVLAAGRPLATEVEVPVGGESRTYALVKFPFAGPAGTLVGGLAVEVTDRVWAERQARAAHRLTRVIVDACPGPIAARDRAGRFLLVNQAQADLLGVAPEAAVGRTEAELTGRPDDPPDAAADGVLTGGPAVTVERAAVSGAWLVSYAPLTAGPDDPRPAGVVTAGVDITARKRAEEAVRDSEARFQAFMRHLPLAAWVTGADGRLVFVNDRCAQGLGAAADQVVGRPLADFLPPIDADYHAAADRAVCESGQPLTSEEEVRMADGSVRSLLVIKFPVPGPDGGWLAGGVGLDVSARVRAEKALRASEAKFRALFESNVVGVVFWDTNGGVSEANDALLGMIGYTRDDLAAGRLSWREITPIEHHPLDDRAVTELLAGADRYTPFEKEYLRKDGGRVPVLLFGAFLPGSRDRGVTFVIDLTDRRQAEDALRASEERAKTLIESVPLVVFEYDGSGRLLVLNRRWVEYTGQAVDQADNGGWAAALHPTDGPHAAAAWEEALRSGRPFQSEYRLRGLDGRYRWHLARALPFRDASGHVVRWLGTITDVHDLKEALRAADEARAAADAANQARADFLASVSHELRTPLGGVIGMADLMAADPLPPAQADRLEVVRGSAARLKLLVDDLLDLAKIDAGRLEVAAVRFDPRAAVAAAIAPLQLDARRKGLGVTVGVAPDVPAVAVGDPHRLAQVVVNLFANAVKFTPRGEVAVAVSCPARGPGRADLRVEVRDTGIGIPADRLEAVFEPFVQAAPDIARRYGGTGLGLSIARKLVGLMGGRLEADSQVGRGSRFVVTVPIGLPDATDAAARPAPDPAMTRPLDVLLADDEGINRRLVGELLRRAGHRVTEASDGQTAVAAAAGRRYDVILMDLQMPDLDGFEAAARVRAGEAGDGRRVPIVALTARAMSGDRDECLRAGMDGYVTKPVDPPTLFAEIARVVAARPGGSDRPAVGHLLQRLGGDAGLLAELAAAFVADAPSLAADLRAAAAAGDLPRLGRAAHKLIGLAGHLVPDDLLAGLRTIDGQARRGDPSGLDRLATAAAAALDQLAAALREVAPAGDR